uniref:Uncharacterized protein n=1 Tax=Arundo donax TaxID=35708 RepID=A0A0A9BWD1_ARUDO
MRVWLLCRVQHLLNAKSSS